MGASTAMLCALRVLALVVGLGVVGVSAWSYIIINNISSSGSTSLADANLSQQQQEAWQSFFTEVLGSKIKIIIAIAGAGFITFPLTPLILSLPMDFRVPSLLSIPLSILSTLSISAALGSTLSIALKTTWYVSASGSPADGMIVLEPSTSSELKGFLFLLPMTKTLAIASGAGVFLTLVATICTVVQALHRSRDSKKISFEPTASALGMGHGYANSVPVPRKGSKSRNNVPTMYDPSLPDPTLDAALHAHSRSNSNGSARSFGRDKVRDEEKGGFAMQGADMGMSDVASIRGKRVSAAGSLAPSLAPSVAHSTHSAAPSVTPSLSLGELDFGTGGGLGLDYEKDGQGKSEISGPLGLKKPEEVAQWRPARPWSEAPKR